MRNIQKLIAFVFVVVVCACTQDDVFETSNTIEESSNPAKSIAGGSHLPTYSNTSLVVQFKGGTSDPQKTAIRAFNGVNNYEVCHCTNQDIELWHFAGVINVEPKKQVIKGQIDPESTTGLLEVDYEFIFGYDMDSETIGTVADVSYESYIKPVTFGTDLTIAVVDTGIAPGLTVFNDADEDPIEFLYDAEFTAVSIEKSGWDFIDEDPNTYDDDLGKHGSIISHMILDALSTQGIDFQLLPVKVSGPLGEVSYFNFLCGTLYAMERADVVNISMGWYIVGDDPEVRTIFENITEANSNTILVTSAGNTENDNDNEYDHYPSSFEFDNIIAVASANKNLNKISNFSNFGPTSVDFFAKGQGIPFYEANVKGTSFAAPQVTIQVANLIDDDTVPVFAVDGTLMMENLLGELIARGTGVSAAFTYRGGELRNTKYNTLIIPFD
ncbi:MAG: S8/S53 family peptidase [Bacteroidota bacterium]